MQWELFGILSTVYGGDYLNTLEGATVVLYCFDLIL